QWGVSAAGGGKYFAIASWYVTSTRSFKSTLKRTASGHVIKGLQSLVGGWWTVGTYDISTGPYTLLKVSHVDGQRIALLGVLEAYSVTSCAQWPGNSTVFSGTGVYNTNYDPWTPRWGVWQWHPAPGCGYGVTVNSTTTGTLRY